MRELGLTGLSEDGRFLVALDPLTDESFHIPTDVRLTSLIDLGSNHTTERPDREAGAREPSMETTLSPRDIQTRIRRGESAEQVADDSGMPLETVRGFAVPVIAEREYIVEQARRTPLRRQHVTGASTTWLGTLVDESVAARGESPERVPWDSWRREDGRWTIVISPAGFSEPATFLFDTKGRYVVPGDEAAHELVGDFAIAESSDMAIADALREEPAVPQPAIAEPVAPAPVAETPGAPPPIREQEPVIEQPTLGAAGELDLELPEALALPVPEDLVEQPASVASLKEARDRRALEQMAFGIDETVASAPAEADDVEITEQQSYLGTKGAKPKGKHERRRVPSWDEIMFGGSRRD